MRKKAECIKFMSYYYYYYDIFVNKFIVSKFLVFLFAFISLFKYIYIYTLYHSLHDSFNMNTIIFQLLIY